MDDVSTQLVGNTKKCLTDTHRFDGKFFRKFARDRFSDRLLMIDFTTWKLPQPTMVFPFGSATDQQRIIPLDYRRHDVLVCGGCRTSCGSRGTAGLGVH